MTAASDSFPRAADVAKPLRSECAAYPCGSSPLCAPIFFTPLPDDACGQAATAYASGAIDGAEQRSVADASRRKPGLQGANGARARVGAVEHGDFLELALLAGLRASKAQHEALVLEADVVDVEPNELHRVAAAPANPTRTSARSRTSIPPFAAGRDHDAQLVDQQGGFRPRRSRLMPAKAPSDERTPIGRVGARGRGRLRRTRAPDHRVPPRLV